MYVLLFFVFFFQAEDGIRDGHVTGVQTCALPIFAALLGASPGASVSVDVMLDVMSRCFDDFPEWEDKIKEMIPSFGISLTDNPEYFSEIDEKISRSLGLNTHEEGVLLS